MTLPSYSCTNCGAQLINIRMIGEEVLMVPHNGHVLAAQRLFDGSCARCGGRRHIKMGHHATLAESRSKKIFPNKIADRLREFLTPEQRLRFDGFREGMVIPWDEEIAEWQKLVFRYYLYLWPNVVGREKRGK